MSGIIDLDCGDYEISASSIGHGQNGYVFRCTIRPVADGVLQSWAARLRLGATVRLVFPERPLQLERVELVRVDALCVRIVGRVVDGQTKKGLLR